MNIAIFEEVGTALSFHAVLKAAVVPHPLVMGEDVKTQRIVRRVFAFLMLCGGLGDQITSAYGAPHNSPGRRPRCNADEAVEGCKPDTKCAQDQCSAFEIPHLHTRSQDAPHKRPQHT